MPVHRNMKVLTGWKLRPRAVGKMTIKLGSGKTRAELQRSFSLGEA